MKGDTGGLLLLALVLGGIAFVAMAGGLSSPQKTSYQNLESWEIVRNEKGRISSIHIHRDAKIT